jgi:hypothetical protein
MAAAPDCYTAQPNIFHTLHLAKKAYLVHLVRMAPQEKLRHRGSMAGAVV